MAKQSLVLGRGTARSSFCPFLCGDNIKQEAVGAGKVCELLSCGGGAAHGQ